MGDDPLAAAKQRIGEDRFRVGFAIEHRPRAADAGVDEDAGGAIAGKHRAGHPRRAFEANRAQIGAVAGLRGPRSSLRSRRCCQPVRYR